VLRNDPLAGFTVLGPSEGIAGLGGLSFDEVLFEYVCAAAGVPVEEMDPYDRDLAAEVAQLRRECIEAKETLSASADAIIRVTLGGVQHWVRLTRAEFEEMIRPDLDRTVEAMHRAFGSAEVVASELDAIVLTGGSSRIPLVSRLIATEFGRAPASDADPKLAVAIGAALFPAPASAPVRDLGGRPAVAAVADGGDGRRAALLASFSHPSRKVLLAGAALVVLVLGGGVTALTTPALSGLITHHSPASGTAASGGVAPSVNGAGSSPTPSAQSSAKSAGKARAGTKTAGSGSNPADPAPPAGPSSVAAAAAQASNKVTSPGKATKSSKPKPSAPASRPATKPPTVRPTTPAPSTTAPTTVPPTTTPPTTPTTAPPTTTPPTTAAPSAPAPSMSAAAGA
jgi:molecular chaperone DnaK